MEIKFKILRFYLDISTKKQHLTNKFQNLKRIGPVALRRSPKSFRTNPPNI